MKRFIAYIFLLLFFGYDTASAQNNPLDVVKSVADRIIKECSFEFELAPQKPVLGIQVLDFTRQFGNSKGSAYALSAMISDNDTSVNLGISASHVISLRINDELINFNRTKSPSIEEIAYGMVNFFDTVSVSVKKGENIILVKSSSPSSTVFIRQITGDPEDEGWIKFSASPFMKESENAGWLFAGTFEGSNDDTPEKSIKQFYINNGKITNWVQPKENILTQLKIGKDNVFKKDSYADWNYANGETILSILTLYEQSGDNAYLQFVRKWCDFIVQNIPYFRYQYDSLHALRGSYHRIFRKSMLDDAGAPVLPFAHLSLKEKNDGYIKILNEMVDYVYNEQVRLDDGTFCRPEPVEMTVWADDLFMSLPVLLRAGIITGETRYFDDAAKQIFNFTRLLYNKDKQLFKHGWFSKTNKTSVAFWGRANGWVMWALTEALLYMPKEHEKYPAIMKIYKDHIDGLIKYQAQNGMWHQVLDHPESYEESSCTAMFVLGIARGINNGWLNSSYKSSAVKGWNALTEKIEPGGIVHGICRGTGIGNDLEFYFTRPTFDNDPRGLGAVLTAGVEMTRLLNKTGN